MPDYAGQSSSHSYQLSIAAMFRREKCKMHRLTTTAGLFLICFTACEPRTAGTSVEDCILGGRGEGTDDLGSPLRLVACRVPQISSEDGSNPTVLVLLINDGPSAVLADRAVELGANLFVELADRQGRVLPLPGEPIPFEPMAVELEILPRHGVLGRFIDLTCELPGNIVLEDDATCVPYVEVERRGEYQVTFIARVQWCSEDCRFEDADVIDLRSDPIPLMLR